ncbi:MAG: hypothetical protein JF586_08355 [Burkholderiales bacterium]|nr:hypothetical protein [Burkholderiales bacterium]
MTLHFDWLHAPRWLAHAHVSRAVSLVLGVIGVSLLFSALRVVDAAVSGALIDRQATAPAGATLLVGPERLLRAAPPSSGPEAAETPTSVEVPEATAEAVSL